MRYVYVYIYICIYICIYIYTCICIYIYMYYTAIIPTVLVYKVTQDFYHQQLISEVEKPMTSSPYLALYPR